MVLRTSYAGLALTVTAAVVPHLARDVLAGHIQHGYPAYSAARTDSAVTTWLTVLSVVGALGVAGWLFTIWTIKAGKPWARWSAAILLVAAGATALAGVTVEDTSGELGLAPLIGWLGVVPCVAGLPVTVGLWRR